MPNNTKNISVDHKQSIEKHIPQNLLEAFFYFVWHLNAFVKTTIFLVIFISVGCYFGFSVLPDKAKTDIWEHFWNPASHNAAPPPTGTGEPQPNTVPLSGKGIDVETPKTSISNPTSTVETDVRKITKPAEPAQVDDLDRNQKALKIISDFANNMCKDVSLKGSSDVLELTGNAKVQLIGVVNKVADLGFGGAAKYKNSNYEGLLQSDFASILKDNTECRLQIWNDLKHKFGIIPKPKSKPKSKSDLKPLKEYDGPVQPSEGIRTQPVPTPLSHPHPSSTLPGKKPQSFPNAGKQAGDNNSESSVVVYADLMWQKNVKNKVMTQYEAQEYCKSLQMDDYADWRLPTISELGRLLDKRYNPPINLLFGALPNSYLPYFWSSTVNPKDDEEGQFLDFGSGLPAQVNKKSGYGFARCVRHE